jgi:hypothetical protein
LPCASPPYSKIPGGNDMQYNVVATRGQSLLMTHYCNAGNQPRLRLRENTRPGVLEFQMFDITNLQSADADHVERAVYRIIDDKTIDLEIVWKKGKSEESEKYTLTRLDPQQHVGN